MGEDSPKLVKSIRNLKRSSYVSLLARQEFWCANLPYCITNIEKKNETKHNRAIKEINKINPGSQVEYDTHKSSIKFLKTSFSKYWKRNFRITIGVSAWEVRQSFPQKGINKPTSDFTDGSYPCGIEVYIIYIIHIQLTFAQTSKPFKRNQTRRVHFLICPLTHATLLYRDNSHQF